MLRILPVLLLVAACAEPATEPEPLPPPPSDGLSSLHSAQPAHEAVSDVLDALHRNASEANYDAYFDLYTDGAVFLGTDASERWPIDDFMEYTAARFAAGTAWTYEMLDRHIDFSPEGDVAWFDETLMNENLGRTRGSGVLLLTDDGWKIAQYNLTILVPNDLARGFAAEIRAFESAGDAN